MPAWKPGQSGNPLGRPKGARHVLSESFVKRLAADFEVHGKEAIENVRASKPDVYLQLVCRVVPQTVELDVSDRRDAREFTSDELRLLLVAELEKKKAEDAPHATH